MRRRNAYDFRGSGREASERLWLYGALGRETSERVYEFIGALAARRRNTYDIAGVLARGVGAPMATYGVLGMMCWNACEFIWGF